MSNKKILVVDDEAHIREILERFLKMKGYEVIVAENGEKALAYFQIEKPKLVLLDIIMPGIGGIEVLDEIKRIDPNARVVMLTAVKEEEIGKLLLKKGSQDYIMKPIDFDYLEKTILVNAFLGS